MESRFSPTLRIWTARFLIGFVVFINLHSAFSFLAHPSRYTTAYELIGVPGEAAIRGIAVLFLMWNIPYLFALWQPLKNRVSLSESILMQTTGLAGETWLVYQIPLMHETLRHSIFRFIKFDSVGLLFLLIAIAITASLWKGTPSNSKTQG
jgi:hypothetical protein